MTELATDSDADDSRSARLGVELLATLAMLSLVMVSGVPLDSAAPRLPEGQRLTPRPASR